MTSERIEGSCEAGKWQMRNATMVAFKRPANTTQAENFLMEMGRSPACRAKAPACVDAAMVLHGHPLGAFALARGRFPQRAEHAEQERQAYQQRRFIHV